MVHLTPFLPGLSPVQGKAVVARFAEPLRDRVRERAAELASAAGITIEHIAKNHIRKEDVVARVLVVRGDRPGLVHIISAMEACDTYKPWHDKHTHRTFLRPDTGKCLRRAISRTQFRAAGAPPRVARFPRVAASAR